MTILVIGGSRGIGAALVRHLDAQGLAGIFTYCEGGDRASRIQAQCPRWSPVHLDLTRLKSNALTRKLDETGTGITSIVVCAAAGLRPGTDAGHAMSVNALGPARFISRIDDVNETHFGVLYLTSPAAHRAQTEKRPDDIYQLVAATKHAGEALLHKLRPRWINCRSVSTVVCDLVKPSTAYTLYRRLDPDTVRELENSRQVVNLEELIPWLASHVGSIEAGHALDPLLEFEQA